MHFRLYTSKIKKYQLYKNIFKITFNVIYRINSNYLHLCFAVPEEFLYDPATRSYGDPARRPEIKNATIEFIAPSDYMVCKKMIFVNFLMNENLP